MQIVRPAGVDLSGVGLEVAVGAVVGGQEVEGVLRVAFPTGGFIPCTWETTLGESDLIEPVGSLPIAKLREMRDVLGLSSLDWVG